MAKVKKSAGFHKLHIIFNKELRIYRTWKNKPWYLVQPDWLVMSW